MSDEQAQGNAGKRRRRRGGRGRGRGGRGGGGKKVAPEQREQELLSRSVATADRLPGATAGDEPFSRSVSVVDGELESHSGHVQEVQDLGFHLDAWQEGAIRAMEAGHHVFVQAPTGAGKTAVVEEFLRRNIESGVTLFYAVPIKALANDKFFDFCDRFGRDRVGINTGDITHNAGAQIVVGTTEILRNILFDRHDAYHVVAFDEAQYLGDEERGCAWEEAIIMASEKTVLTFLSGSVANADEVLGWIRHIKSVEVALFEETKRPVPLRHAFPFGDGFLEAADWKSLRSLADRTGRSYYGSTRDFLAAVVRARMTPMLVFMPRRRDCENFFDDAETIPPEETGRLKELLEAHPEGHLLNLRVRLMILKKGCAFHHSGLLPAEKRVIEQLAKKGHLRYVAATMSLASGVNFSVRTALIAGYRRPGHGGDMQRLKPSEVLQMWGRAGRRRMDTEGYIIPCTDIRDLDAFEKVQAYPERIERPNFVSAMNILSILGRYNVEKLEELYDRSFSSFVYKTRYRLFADHVMVREAGSICGSPTYNLPPYRQGVYQHLKKEQLAADFRCATCPNLSRCTAVYEEIKPNPLQRMLKHLMMSGFLGKEFSLTLQGRLAERFHNEIGLLVGHDIAEGRVRPDNILHYAAAASAPGHVSFDGGKHRVSLDAARRIYPQHFFPTLWERQRRRLVFVYWNPAAGDVCEQWAAGGTWEAFAGRKEFEHIQGDVFRMILRTGELLRGFTHLKDLRPALAEAAHVALKQILRPPLVPESLF